MSGPTTPGTPPEVPEEFAEAYRAAYEAALEAQSVPGRRGTHAERTRTIRVGTHRATESAWFVPVLLVVLALLLVLGAYVFGRVLANHVGGTT